MFLKKDKQSLHKQLDIAEKALPGKTTMPLLQNIFMEKDSDKLTLMATNLEIGIKSNLKLDGELEDSEEAELEQILIPAKIIDIVKHLPEQEVKIKVDAENYNIHIQSGEAKFNLKGINAEEYPVFAEQEPEKKPLKLKEKELKESIRRTIFATSSDEGRPAFTGLLISIEGQSLNFIASDTYRLVIEEKEIEEWGYEENKFLVPARSLRELSKLLGDDEDEVWIYPVDKQLIFSFKDIFFFTRLLEDKFPDFRKVIPSEHTTRITVEKELFEDLVSRAALLSDNISRAMKLKLEDQELMITSSSEMGKMEEGMPVKEQEGEDIEILLNVKFVMDILRVLDCEEIEIKFSGREAPTIMRPAQEDNYLYLVLPIKVEQPM